MVQNPASASFVRELRHALLHLYDAAELRRSALVHLLGVDKRDDPPSALRRLLLQAIAALKPPASVPAQANAWRVHQTLTLRYAEQYTQREVATNLSLSLRQVRRQDSRALRALADYLWAAHDLQHQAAEGASPLGESAEEGEPSDHVTPSREQEMEWLRRSLPNEAADVGALIHGVLRTLTPLMQASAVRLQCSFPEEPLPRVTVQQAAVRQALLNVLTAAARCAAGGSVALEVRNESRHVHVRIRPSSHPATTTALHARDRECLEMAGQLAKLAGGDLLLLEGAERPFDAALSLPAAEQIAVLIIDDNADTLELMRRYLAGTRYRFLGAPDPALVLASADDPVPDIIVLDVMLPAVDGWELLERLREHPRTQRVPVIVCTILPQEDLARSLGAAAFLRKPLSRRALLAALDQQAALLAKEAS